MNKACNYCKYIEVKETKKSKKRYGYCKHLKMDMIGMIRKECEFFKRMDHE